eukprot:5589803-Alexandrium_andersonii.AAC.1
MLAAPSLSTGIGVLPPTSSSGRPTWPAPPPASSSPGNGAGWPTPYSGSPATLRPRPPGWSLALATGD